VDLRNFSDLSSAGTSRSWVLLAMDSEQGGAYSILVSPDGVTAAPSPNELRCTAQVEGGLSSADAVPDALARLSLQGVIPSRWHYQQRGACENFTLPPGATVEVSGTRESGPKSSWSVYYGVNGEFLRVCGPCPTWDCKC
jgi:hypothetical protein